MDVCGMRSWAVEPYLRPAPEKRLDKRGRHAYYVEEVRANFKPLTPEEVLKLRRSVEMSQQDFSQLLGVTVMTVSRWERGVTAPNGPVSFYVRSRVKEHKEKFAVA